MNRKYVILRNTSRIDLSDPFGPGPGLESMGGNDGADLEVEVEDLAPTDVAELRRDPQVAGLAPDMPARLVAPTAQAEASITAVQQHTWGVTATGADDSPFTGAGVKVAILDTGIDPDHPAFAGVDIIQRDFTGEGNGDGNGHGTHCAGTVFGQTISGVRFGVAQGIQRAIIGKVLGTKGGGSTAGIYNGITWAVEEGADIISMSLGFDFPGYVKFLVEEQGLPIPAATSMGLEAYRGNIALFDRLAATLAARSGIVGKGVIIVAAAGNESERDAPNNPYEIAVAPPAAAERILAVGALATQGAPHDQLKVAAFSNSLPAVSGPGVDILSAWPGGQYRFLNGTSMATPHVAGIAALWAEKLLGTHGRISPNLLLGRLVGRSNDERLAAGEDAADFGAGIVQAPRH